MHIVLLSRCVIKMSCCRCIVESSLHNINDDYGEVVVDDVVVVVLLLLNDDLCDV